MSSWHTACIRISPEEVQIYNIRAQAVAGGSKTMKKPINKPLGIVIGSVITILFTLSAFTVLTYDTSADMKRADVAERSGWEKLDFGDSLYGLPQISGAHIRTWDKLNYGEDLYGLPHIAVTDVKRQFDHNHSVSFVTKDVVETGKITWDKINFGDEIYGLPQISGAHMKTWDRLNYGDDLYGLPIGGKFHG